MLVFIDESGDTGLAIDRGATKYFAMFMVVFEDHDDAIACDQRINLLRRELHLSQNFEFHFHRNSDRVRDSFLRAVLPYQFFYYGIVINKKKLTKDWFSIREPFYQYAAGLLFENAKERLDQAIVVVGKSGRQLFKYQLASYLKEKMNQQNGRRLIKKLKMQDSKSNNLLQLTDVIAGAVHRSLLYEDADSQQFRAIIKPREIRVQIWP